MKCTTCRKNDAHIYCAKCRDPVCYGCAVSAVGVLLCDGCADEAKDRLSEAVKQ